MLTEPSPAARPGDRVCAGATRGHRVDLLKDAIGPLKGRLKPRQFKRLAQALSLMFGVEVVTVLKDIWGLDSTEMMSVAQWAAGALVRAAMAESEAKSAGMSTLSKAITT